MKKVIQIEGMSCGHCAMHVEKSLSEVNGVSSAKVDLKKKIATVEVEEQVSDESLLNAVKEAGYEPIDIEIKKGFFGK